MWIKIKADKPFFLFYSKSKDYSLFKKLYQTNNKIETFFAIFIQKLLA